MSQRSCEFAGRFYATGAVSCQSHAQAQCDDGKWRSLGVLCVVPDGAVVGALQARTCAYAGAQFEPQSMMCKDGLAFLCQQGRWTSLQAACD